MPTIDVTDLRPTIVPKSDQLNAEQLLGGPMTVTITDVGVSSSPEQPVTVHYEGENGRPFKPCKTMRKLMVFAWGPDGTAWAGKSMTLYNDPAVKFGGDEVGGIRISHMSHIPKSIEVSLTSTRGKKALYRVALLEEVDAKFMGEIRAADSVDGLKAVFARAWKAVKSDSRRASLKQAYDKRHAELMEDPPFDSADDPSTGSDPAPLVTRTYAEVADAIARAKTPEALDVARSLIAEVSNLEHQAELRQMLAKAGG